MGWYEAKLHWGLINESSVRGEIENLGKGHHKYAKLLQSYVQRLRMEQNLPITPYCLAIIIAMAQKAAPQQRLTLFHIRHKLNTSASPGEPKIDFLLYCYRYQVSEAYLQKFEQPYLAFDADLTVNCQIIPLKNENFDVIREAVRRAIEDGGQSNIPLQTGAASSVNASTAIHEGTKISKTNVSRTNRKPIRW